MSTVPPHELAARSKLRWAIGSLDGPRSSAWFLSGKRKGDFYVAVPSLGGIAKASFHKDGRCQVGFANEYQATASQRFGVTSRHWQRWQVPAAPMVRVLQIIVPHAELHSFVDRNPHEVTWLPMPPEGSVAVVSIFVSAPGVEPPSPRGAHGPLVVGTVPTSIRTAWVVYTHHPPDAALAQLISDERAKLQRIPGAASWPPGTRAALWDSRPDHDRHVLELACP
jgi:hypothetical protein